MAGDESDDYANELKNLRLFGVNTIANQHPAINPLQESPVMSAFERPMASSPFTPAPFPVDGLN
jgi:hypothetical protein